MKYPSFHTELINEYCMWCIHFFIMISNTLEIIIYHCHIISDVYMDKRLALHFVNMTTAIY